MVAREKLAWALLAMVAAALAAATFTPPRMQASSAAAQISSAELESHLTRIEQRLDRLESPRLAHGAGSAAAAAGARASDTGTTMPAEQPRLETSPTGDRVPAPVPAAEATAASEQSRLVASTLVEHAIQSGTWTRKDAAEWMAASAGLRAEDRYALVRRLVIEVNEDHLKLDPGATFR